MKLELLTDATVVDDAIRFVSHASKENLKSSTECDKDEDQLKEAQEEKTEEIITTNQVF